ncbi:helix-turn-helix domain-containing protein [Streptomyces sp. NPDC002817]|uniref:helix-turn-helix domain-containing protein n=1 Tax=Streptomyces sp. NPDC088357 TaxID=3154655 RepID=UPI00341826B7
MPAEAVAACHAEASRQWARTHISGDVGVEHFNRLAQQLIDAADADALPLFAGRRAQPCPDKDPVGAAMPRIHVLREHRGACHLAAVRLSGPSAQAAVVINLGTEQAAHYGWEAPVPATAALLPQGQRAERLTTELQAPLCATLTTGQRTEFAQLVSGLTMSSPLTR